MLPDANTASEKVYKHCASRNVGRFSSGSIQIRKLSKLN